MKTTFALPDRISGVDGRLGCGGVRELGQKWFEWGFKGGIPPWAL